MNWHDFHFIRPMWLLAFIPYIALLTLLVRSKLSQGNWSQVCDAELLPYLLEDKAVAHSRWPLLLGATAAFIAIFALAGPTWERLPAPAFRNDSALVIVLDLSNSMNAADVKPNRLTMARYKISDILKQRKDGQSALIAYSGDAFTVTPLTTDTETIDNQLSALTPEIMPSDGNNINRALDKAVALMKQAGLQKGQILLLTDGGDTDETIAKAKTLDSYSLLVLSVGTAGGAPIALPSGDFLKDDQGNIIIDKVDIAALEKLAHAGGGAYHALTSDDSDIAALLTTVASRLQAQEGKSVNKVLEQWSDKGPWLLLAVLPLSALAFRKGVLAVLLLVFLPWPKTGYALEMPKNWQDLWLTKDQQAQEAYNNKDYNKAAELFANPDWKAAAEYKSDSVQASEMKEAHSAIGLYNQGNVLAVRQEYEKAIANYAKALNKSPDQKLKEDIEYNKKLVEDALQKKQDEKKQQNQNQQNKDDQKDSQDKQQQNPQQNKDGKSSNQAEQKQQDSQQSGDEDKKPEQRPEQSQEDLEKQAEEKAADDKKKNEDKQQQAQAQAPKPDESQDKNEPEGEQAMPAEMSKEEQQANQQWLNRIPDDPAGLLRRKFKYQYDQRGQQQ